MTKEGLNYPLALCEYHKMNLKFSEIKVHKWIETRSRTEEREGKVRSLTSLQIFAKLCSQEPYKQQKEAKQINCVSESNL